MSRAMRLPRILARLLYAKAPGLLGAAQFVLDARQASFHGPGTFLADGKVKMQIAIGQNRISHNVAVRVLVGVLRPISRAAP